MACRYYESSESAHVSINEVACYRTKRTPMGYVEPINVLKSIQKVDGGVITGLRVGSVKPGVRRDPTFGPAWQVADWKRRRCRRCRRCWRAAFGRVCNQVRGFMNWRFLQGSTFPELPARCCCCRCAVAWAVAGDCRAGRIIDACCFGSRRRRKALASACSTTIRVRIFSLLTPRAFENSII